MNIKNPIHYKKLLTTTTALALAGLCPAQTVINGGFEDTTGVTDFGPFFPPGTLLQGVPVGWTFTLDTSSIPPGQTGQTIVNVIDYTLPGTLPGFAAPTPLPGSGNYYMEGYNFYDPGTLSQTVSDLSPGRAYRLTFDFGNGSYGPISSDFDVTMSIADQSFSESGSGLVNMSTKTLDFVTASGVETIAIEMRTVETFSNGAWDNISISPIQDPAVLSAIIGSTGALYEAAPAILAGFTQLPKLEQRVGQRQEINRSEQSNQQGGWIRMHGVRSDFMTGSGSTVDSDLWGMQAGYDWLLKKTDSGQWVLGATAQYGTQDARVRNFLGWGKMESEGYGGGLTATWYGQSGIYIDLQAQINWVDSDFESSSAGDLADDEDSKTYAASVEVGRSYQLKKGRLIPQAQLSWSEVDGGSFTDDSNLAVDLGSNSDAILRLGLAYEYASLDPETGRGYKGYLIGNILRKLSPETSVRVAGVEFATETEENWAELGLGGTYSLSETASIYGEAAYRRAFNNSSSNESISLTAGLRVLW